MFGLPTLARYKLHALIGRNARQRPRDVYDTAWLMEHWPDAIDAPTKTKLAAWHRSVVTESALYAKWEEVFRTDGIGRRAPLITLLQCLSESLEASNARTRDEDTHAQPPAATDRARPSVRRRDRNDRGR